MGVRDDSELTLVPCKPGIPAGPAGHSQDSLGAFLSGGH